MLIGEKMNILKPQKIQVEKLQKIDDLNLEKENYRLELEKGMYRDMASINENFKRLGIDVEKI